MFDLSPDAIGKSFALGHDGFHSFLSTSLRNRSSGRPPILPLSAHLPGNPFKPHRFKVLDVGCGRLSLCRCGKHGWAAGEGTLLPAALRAPDDDGVGRARPLHGIVNHRPRARFILRFAVSVRP